MVGQRDTQNAGDYLYRHGHRQLGDPIDAAPAYQAPHELIAQRVDRRLPSVQHAAAEILSDQPP